MQLLFVASALISRWAFTVLRSLAKAHDYKKKHKIQHVGIYVHIIESLIHIHQSHSSLESVDPPGSCVWPDLCVRSFWR